jgi:prepilin-type N-terminal cleavage/methylation domain-containing protein
MKNLISMLLKSMPGSAAGRIRDRGFTLIELLVTLAVASIVMAAIYSVYATLTRSYTTQNASADVQQAVRASIDLMAEDIMMAGLKDPWEGYGGSPPEILTAGEYEMSFTSDRNMDLEIAGNTESITYRLVGRQLQITDPDGTETLIDNVINRFIPPPDGPEPVFRDFSENPDDLTNDDDLISAYGYSNPMDADDEAQRADIRTVEISITVEEPAGRDGTVQRIYTTRVRCRNAGF